jgi:hypothetical protein
MKERNALTIESPKEDVDGEVMLGVQEQIMEGKAMVLAPLNKAPESSVERTDTAVQLDSEACDKACETREALSIFTSPHQEVGVIYKNGKTYLLTIAASAVQNEAERATIENVENFSNWNSNETLDSRSQFHNTHALVPEIQQIACIEGTSSTTTQLDPTTSKDAAPPPAQIEIAEMPNPTIIQREDVVIESGDASNVMGLQATGSMFESENIEFLSQNNGICCIVYDKFQQWICSSRSQNRIELYKTSQWRL